MRSSKIGVSVLAAAAVTTSLVVATTINGPTPPDKPPIWITDENGQIISTGPPAEPPAVWGSRVNMKDCGQVVSIRAKTKQAGGKGLLVYNAGIIKRWVTSTTNLPWPEGYIVPKNWLFFTFAEATYGTIKVATKNCFNATTIHYYITS